jgi:hypothetical protein
VAWATAASPSKELRDIFNLDPDRPEDRPAIAALQASATRLLDEPGPLRHSATFDTSSGSC